MFIYIKMSVTNIKFGTSNKVGRPVQHWGSTLDLGYVQIGTQSEHKLC